MHEASIAQGLLDTAIENCRREGYLSIRSVTVRIGRAVNIFPDALQFAFDAGKDGTIAQDAMLTIEYVPVVAQCNNCGAGFESADVYVTECPQCGSFSLVIVSGNELQLVELDVE